MTKIFFSFIAGVVTISSPCVIPILPIVLSSALKKNRLYPVMMVLGLATMFSALGVLFGAFGSALGIAPGTLNTVAIVILLLMGIVIVFDGLNSKLSLLLAPLMNKCSRATLDHDHSLTHGFFLGMVLGVIWAPCAGPILASILALAASTQSLVQGFWLLFIYSIGAGIPMLLIAYGGHHFLKERRFLTTHSKQIKKAFGWILILTAVLLYFGLFKKLEALLLPYFPTFINRF